MSNVTIEPELNSLRSKLVVEIESDAKQIEFLKKRIDKHQALLNAVKGSLGVIHPEILRVGGYGGKADAIREAIKHLPRRFTQDQLEAQLRSLNPEMDVNRNRIRASLYTLASKERGIRIAERGNNQKPAMYERIEEQNKPELALSPSNPNEAVPSELTAGILEDSIRAKTGRVYDISKRLHVDQSVVEALLEPNSKVYVGDKGWLKLRG